MKKKGNREVIILLVIIPVFLIAALTISKYRDGQGDSYTVSGKGASGFSIIYETLNKTGFSASYGNKLLEGGEPYDIQVVVELSNAVRNNEDLKRWVKSGGSLLILTTYRDYELAYGSLKIKKSSELSVYGFDEGTIIIADAYSLANKALAKDTGPAYSIVETLSTMGYKRVFFNEYYTYGTARKVSLWRDIPHGIKLVLYQCLLILILLVLYKGKRFGRIVPYYEEAERLENEYVFSAASLFKEAKCYDAIFESYFKMLLYEMKKEFKLDKEITRENFLRFWKEENLPEIDKAMEVDSIMKRAGEKISRREYLKAIACFDVLTETLRKRSEIYWKQLRIKG